MSLRTYTVERDPFTSRAFFPVFSTDDLTGPEGVERLFAIRNTEETNGVALNTAFPDVEERYRAFVGHLIRPEKRLNVVGLGDVGGTLVTALKLLGDGIREIGVYDPNEALCRRYEMELNQVLDREKPLVRILHEDELFDCDAFLFTASRGVPPLGAAGDVRMLQFEKNRDMLKAYTKKAREAHFSGLFCQISDPVDQLSRCAFLQSNRDEAGDYDFKGLLPEQVAGFGLGVMKARAAYMARRLEVDEGPLRAYGPHGAGLVIANSPAEYNSELSNELTRLTVSANREVRALGFKPYIAPAISSVALSILFLLRGEEFHGAIPMGGVYFGCVSRMTPAGSVVRGEKLHSELKARLRAAWAELSETEDQCRL